MKRRQKVLGLAAAVCALPLVLAACGGSGSSSTSDPATVEHVAGAADRVTLTATAAKRLRVQTAVATTEAGRTVIPFAAVLYSASGTASTYVRTKRLTFERTSIVVDRIDGDRAVLTHGPAPGARVVTVGAVELLGAESGLDG